MTAEVFLLRLEAVRKVWRGWQARCPAHHPDRHPSLSICEGDKGLLVRCWAGCELSAIVAALGLTVADLFYDSGLSPEERRRVKRVPKLKRYDWRKAAAEYQDYALGLRLRAELVLAAAKELDISEWTGEQLNRATRAVSKAYSDLDRAEVLEGIYFSICARGLEKEKDRAPQRAA
jgi:hypothetical protein